MPDPASQVNVFVLLYLALVAANTYMRVKGFVTYAQAVSSQAVMAAFIAALYWHIGDSFGAVAWSFLAVMWFLFWWLRRRRQVRPGPPPAPPGRTARPGGDADATHRTDESDAPESPSADREKEAAGSPRR